MTKIGKKLMSILLTMMVSVSAFAQITTSSLNGRVVYDNGEPVVGAVVVATHVPSGSQYYGVANTDGRYSIEGIRPGDGYKIEFSFLGYQTLQYNEVTISLGETYTQNAELTPQLETLDEVLVVASTSKFSTEKTGASTNISSMQISSLPMVNRSMSDIVKYSPYANGMSFAGGDGRSTNFTVDGANFNNNFGLSDALPGGGNPISLEAIEEEIGRAHV